jgi:uncharacterized membrane protein YgcG
LFFPLYGKNLELHDFPQQVYARQFSTDYFEKNIKLRSNGNIHVSESYFPRFNYNKSTQFFKVSVPTGEYRMKQEPVFFNGWNWLGRKDRFIISGLEKKGLEERGNFGFNQQFGVPADLDRNEIVDLSLDYEIKGILEKDEQFYSLKYPVWTPNEEPLKNGLIRLEFEDPPSGQIIGWLKTKSGKIVRELDSRDGKLEVHIPSEFVNTDLYLETSVSASSVAGYGVIQKLPMVWYNNMPLFLSLILFFCTFILWKIFGRDIPGVIMARYRPPEGMTPAEAGFLWDEKLHSKDLVSLIYYWAVKGHLNIRQLSTKKKNRDYEFTKLHELPGSVEKFESTIFDGIFASGDKVKLSDLKYKFYVSFDLARKQFKKFQRKRGYYVRGTKGFGLFMVITGVILSLIAIGFFIAGLFDGDFRYGIPLVVAAVSLIVFGRIMPRMNNKARLLVDHLMGFREFIRSAETERLEVLIKEDPSYFGLTLPFAIVMGEGDAWAAKFDDLITVPPEWYQGYDGSSYSTSLFVNDISDSMHVMRGTFNAVPAPKSSGRSSSWSGSSSFGGGFSSGGGFGGGGGSSW